MEEDWYVQDYAFQLEVQATPQHQLGAMADPLQQGGEAVDTFENAACTLATELL